MQEKAKVIIPSQKTHAVEEAVFVIKFPSPLSEDQLKKALSLQEELKEIFPRIVQKINPGLQLKIEKGGSPQFSDPGQKLTGVIFERFKTDATPEKIISVEGFHIAFHCFNYSRWKNVWPEARRFLKKLIDEISISPVELLALSVRDCFIFNGSFEEFDPALVFRKDSLFLVQNVFSIRNLWHSHHGFFELSDNKIVEKDLLVTNISTEADSSSKMKIRIDCFFESRLKPPGLMAEELFSDDKNLIDEIFNILHTKNKKILNKIITPETAASICLEVK